MRVTTYGTRLSEDKHTILVKETSTNYPDADKLDEASKIARMMSDVFELSEQATEYMYMIAMNSKCRPIGVFEMSHGTMDATQFSIKDFFIRLFLCGSNSFVLVHNHPSGEPEPSKEDLAVTTEMMKAANLMGVILLDHIIIGENGNYYSMHQHELF